MNAFFSIYYVYSVFIQSLYLFNVLLNVYLMSVNYLQPSLNCKFYIYILVLLLHANLTIRSIHLSFSIAVFTIYVHM